MEEKRRDAGTLPAATASSAGVAEFQAAEPASTRRRAGGQKRKANALSASSSSSTPSKRITREKSMLISHSPIHNGPLTRARQAPNSLATGSALVPGSPNLAAGFKPEEQKATTTGKDSLRPEEEGLNKASEEWEALEAKIEAEVQAIRSRHSNARVVPSHCGWFSWTKIHSLEERSLPTFFNGKSQTRTPDVYLDIRNWLMKKFHANPNTQIVSKDLSELEVGDLDARQEVMDFLDYWGLINFHPFPPAESAVAGLDGDGMEKKDSLIDKLYHFEAIQSYQPVIPKPHLMTPTMPSGLFPESAIAEELVKQEGPAVEYHCNSCSADCSRKRYHCQKQADFDLCTDCFNNGKFGSDMSTSDFILMEPAEVPGVSGGKWTDQETLLLLEALELYKENWNEIAEHVATKTKAQCILHFVQMPIEDAFLDCEDDVDATSKEIADPASTNDNSSNKDVPETTEGKTGANDSQPLTSSVETSKPEDASEVKVCEETSKSENRCDIDVGQETSNSRDTNEVKGRKETGEDIAVKALKEAFETIGYVLTPENPMSFADVGNPVMALAAFLTRLVDSDVATVSAHASLKSLSGSSTGMQLATRHSFLLEDPPDDKKELAASQSAVAEMSCQDAHKDEKPEDNNKKEDNSTSLLDGRDLSNDHSDKNVENSLPEEKRPPDSNSNESTTKQNSSKEPGKIATLEEIEPGNLKESTDPKLSKDHQTDIVKEPDNLATSVPSSSLKESGGGTSGEPLLRHTESAKVVNMPSDHLTVEKEHGLLNTSKSIGEASQPTESLKDVEMADSLPSEKNEPQQPATVFEEGPAQPMDAAKNVDMMSDAEGSQQPVTSNSVLSNGAATGEDQTKDGKKEKHDRERTRDDHIIDKVKRAAVSALSAASVKAKLLANQEEDQIRQLATSLMEKQLHKLENKLAFFNEMDSVMMRVREQLDRSRQRLYHERAQIIAARLGLPASSSRTMPPSLPTNRIATNLANSVPRLPVGMTLARPPISRPTGTVAPTSNPLVSTTMTGSSVQPSGPEKLSSIGTK